MSERAREMRERREIEKEKNGGWTASELRGQDKIDRSDSISLIAKDIPRTMPEIQVFHNDGPLEESLFLVLETYVIYRPDVGNAENSYTKNKK